MIRAVLLPLPLLLLLGAAPQRENPLSAQLSSGVIRFGDQAMLAITVDDVDDPRIGAVPAVDGLRISPPGQPSVQSGMTYVNGRRSTWRRTRFNLAIRAERTGEFQIPPIEVSVGGQVLRTPPLALRVVEDLRGADLGFLEITPSPARVVEGQPFSLELRFGWDQGMQAQFANLSLPWWEQLPGTLDLEGGEPGPGASVVSGVTVNDRVQVSVEEIAPTSVGGRTYRTLRLVKSLLPSRSGTLEFPTSFLEFGEVERSVFSSRKGKSFFVSQPAFTVEVVPLPEEGRPLDYSGAVGALTVRASVDTADVRVGESIKLTVDWTGPGNLEFFASPDPARIDAFRDFRVYGKTEEKDFDRRRVVYDLAPLRSDVDEIPALPLPVFDPGKGAYGAVVTDPIPIRVRPLEGAVELGGAEERRYERDVHDIDARPIGGTPSDRTTAAPGDRALLVALLALGPAWLGLRSAVRRRRGDPGAPLERRRRRAARRLARELARAADARADHAAFTRFLAARTREPDAAWVGRDPRAWRAGRPEDAADLDPAELPRLAGLLERLDAAVFGGGARVPADELLAAARRLARRGRVGAGARALLWLGPLAVGLPGAASLPGADAIAFARGVEAYRRGDPAGAELSWREALEAPLGPAERARVLYDLGNAAWRQGEALEAIGWWEACLRVDPRHADARHNAELARAEEGLEPLDRGDLRSTVARLAGALRPAEARRFVALALALLAACLAWEAFLGGRPARLASLGAAGLVALACVPWAVAREAGEGAPLLAIQRPVLELRSEPRRDLEPIASVDVGVELERIDELPGWVRVRTDAGVRGWVPETAVFPLAP